MQKHTTGNKQAMIHKTIHRPHRTAVDHALDHPIPHPVTQGVGVQEQDDGLDNPFQVHVHLYHPQPGGNNADGDADDK